MKSIRHQYGNSGHGYMLDFSMVNFWIQIDYRLIANPFIFHFLLYPIRKINNRQICIGCFITITI